jgi:hypothetical protein
MVVTMMGAMRQGKNPSDDQRAQWSRAAPQRASSLPGLSYGTRGQMPLFKWVFIADLPISSFLPSQMGYQEMSIYWVNKLQSL